MSAISTKDAERSFVSVAFAARALGVSEATIRRRLDDGRLRGYKLGPTRRVLRSDLERVAGKEHS